MKRIFAHLGFSFALTLLIINIISVSLVPVITCALLLLFITSLLLPKYRNVVSLPLCLGSAVLACLVFLTVYYSAVVPELRLDGTSAITSFYITDLPHKTDFGYSYVARALTVERDGSVQNFKIRIISDSLIKADSYQLIKGELKFYSLGDSAFSSYGYWGKGIYLTARVKDYTVTDTFINSPMRCFLSIRANIISTLTGGIKGDEGALAAALITGNKDALSSEVYNYFWRAGVTHLMAVSGLHLTVVSGAVTYLLSALKVPDKLKSALVILVIALFAAVTGFSPSVVRAGIMMVTIIGAGFFKKRGDVLNSLGIAVLIICLNPFAVSDIGAVLSVISVLSLCTLYPRVLKRTNKLFTKLYKRHNRVISNVGEFAAYVLNICIASFCVMLYNLPVLYLYYLYFSPISIFANVLLIPLGSLSTVMSFVAVIFSGAGVLGRLIFTLDKALNGVIISVLRLFAGSRYSVIPAGKYLGIILSGILIILAFCFILNNKRLIKYTAVVSVCALVIYQGAVAVQAQSTAEVLFTESGACAVISKNETLVIGVKNKSDYYSVKSFIGRGGNISLLIAADGKDSITEKLTEEFNCMSVISYAFSPELLNGAEEYRLETDYSAELSDRLSITVNHYNTGYSYLIKVNGVSISDPSEADISVNNKTVTDGYGVISLSDGDVLYSINKNKDYSARRVEAWQN